MINNDKNMNFSTKECFMLIQVSVVRGFSPQILHSEAAQRAVGKRSQAVVVVPGLMDPQTYDNSVEPAGKPPHPFGTTWPADLQNIASFLS